MTQVVSDVLPIDAGTQKFLAPVDPGSANFALLWAVAVQTFASKQYAALGVLPVWKTDTTHNGLEVTDTPVKRGTGGSSTAGVDGRGFNKCTVFATVSGLGGGETLTLSAVPRLTQTGADHAPATTIANNLGNGDNAVTFDVASPFFMIEAVASAGAATVTVNLYLHRG